MRSLEWLSLVGIFSQHARGCDSSSRIVTLSLFCRQVIADLESDRDRMAEELGQTRAEFEKQIAEATSAAKLAQDDLQMMSEQLDAAQVT